ncbi:MAG TPA: IPT/TIG domain-containing protein, partial [Acidimicrobiales bacterium]
MSLSTELTTQRPLMPLRVISRTALAAATCLVATVVLVVLPVAGSPSNVAAAATLPTSQSVVVGGDISCGPADSNFSGANSSTCQQRATASLIHSLSPNYLIAGGDTQYTPTATEGVQPAAADYTAGYGGSWAGLQTSGNANFVPGLVVRPTPGDHEYGDANENDRGSVSNASNYFNYFGGLGDLPAGVTAPSNDFYSFDIPLAGGTWHVITLDSECAALPATVGGAPSQGAAGCASGSPEETFLRNDLIAHQGDCVLIHFHEPEFSDVFGTDTDYQAFWNDAVQYHVTAMLNGHAHDYERFSPMNAAGGSSSTGVAEFVVGTGGDSHVSGSKIANEAFQDTSNFGVLQMTLNATSANYTFDKVGGGTEDSGTLNCQQPTGSGVPTVTSVSPSSGSPAGATSVTITGTNLSAVSAVRFGAKAAANFTLGSATSMTATSPAGAVGKVDVSVTNSAGTSATSPGDQFTYTSPAGTLTPVGTFGASSGTGLTTLAVTPQNVGDVLVVYAQVGVTTLTLSSVTGGGVATWTKGV